MKKYILLLSIILVMSCVHAQDSITYKVPHQISIEGGYRNVFSVIDRSNALGGNTATNGFGVLVDYAWKVSGLNGKKPAVYLSVPIGYTMMFADNAQSKGISMLNYGWTVRHELGKNKTIIPFLGYGLLLNSLSVKGVDGSVMGHQTQFEFGANLNSKTRLKYFAKAEYSYTSYPKLSDAKRVHFQFLDVRVGVRF